VADVQADDLASLGRLDIVHCFGLLYHLDSPVIALRRLHDVCGELLLLETMVCDSSAPMSILADEPGAVNQALAGLGCRPSPAFIVTALNRIGFRHIYGATTPPRHPDFSFEWRDNGDVVRDEYASQRIRGIATSVCGRWARRTHMMVTVSAVALQLSRS
jgi:hypothetical protein